MTIEKAKVLVNALATVVIPLVIAFVGHQYTSAFKDKDAQLRFVELSIGILSEEPTEDTEALRSWAARVVDKYSGVSFTESERRSIVEKSSFPDPRFTLRNRSTGGIVQ